jgi:hypothetical protein
MHTTIAAARGRGHLSRRERLELARAEAFSRRTGSNWTKAAPVSFSGGQLELVDRLVRRDRTAVSSALLAVAGIGSSELVREAVLACVGEAAERAQAHNAISSRRAAQIARQIQHAQRAKREFPGRR